MSLSRDGFYFTALGHTSAATIKGCSYEAFVHGALTFSWSMVSTTHVVVIGNELIELAMLGLMSSGSLLGSTLTLEHLQGCLVQTSSTRDDNSNSGENQWAKGNKFQGWNPHVFHMFSTCPQFMAARWPMPIQQQLPGGDCSLCRLGAGLIAEPGSPCRHVSPIWVTFER